MELMRVQRANRRRMSTVIRRDSGHLNTRFDPKLVCHRVSVLTHSICLHLCLLCKCVTVPNCDRLPTEM